jgi:hypothetical protein
MPDRLPFLTVPTVREMGLCEKCLQPEESVEHFTGQCSFYKLRELVVLSREDVGFLVPVLITTASNWEKIQHLAEDIPEDVKKLKAIIRKLSDG